MFDVGASELLLIAVVAIVVIGPKDMPLALRTAGRWIAKIRRVSGHFRSGIETMIREAELEDMEKKWREQNAQIMAAHPDASTHPEAASAEAASAEAALSTPPHGNPAAEAGGDPGAVATGDVSPPAEPQLPLGGPVSRNEP
ncbi:Sec-independent protein translocase protein TatB homolog [Caenibius tardaugens NBRC 16725]|uniref:Sec-independent protein translocase protein TatB n=1 Tax=Caenibius tardaugens NBRC 16725 TaxID=1219035 RepID=U2Y8A0_9SPHN|nr:Sec-independent protein translocase protein TatB [Caenibius tardaugens]AZI36771.1 twin-arginine translocase subunit TatB [Caenibius tardaugens NBRC 16725]GAD49446.1 Sec-independent protein translocase protein TatB homolog [Caenibius tardaugens NBRC 16725]